MKSDSQHINVRRTNIDFWQCVKRELKRCQNGRTELVESQKYEPMFNLALNVSESQREQSETLDVGFNEKNNTWEVIVRYVGNIDFLIQYGAEIVYLQGNYAIVTAPDEIARRLSEFPEIIYVEMPKSMYIEVVNGITASCINPLRSPGFSGGSLYGDGVICAVIDSGIDIFNQVFRNSDGTTRILEIWDQNIDGNPPDGYYMGSIYLREEINSIIQNYNIDDYTYTSGIVVPARDVSGHGTHVAGIMAGNFAENKINNVGIATRSDIIVVKLNVRTKNGFPRTTELMQAVDYVYKAAVRYKKPVAVNISIGNSYGSHDGTSLLETYIDNISTLWKMSICIATGNEGASAGHSKVIIETGQTRRISFSVGEYERSLNIQIWKTYEDEFEFTVFAPGEFSGVQINSLPGVLNTQIGNNRLLVYCGEPSPYSRFQEIYLEIIPFLTAETYITSGIWSISARAGNVVSGRVDMWMPDSGALNDDTRFTNPDPDTTLTIPSTSISAISVGGYNSFSYSYADFSGRGYTRLTNQIKPDIIAPAVNIMSAAVGGAMTAKTGTSMACPFVSGSAALLMQWGIVNQNDPYLYGEKLKSYLIKGAKKLPGELLPSKKQGFGMLCARDSLPV